MNNKKALSAVLILSAASIIVLIFAHFFPEESGLILAIFLSTVVLLAFIILVFQYILGHNKIMLDMHDIASVTENLNTEVAIWLNDCSAVFLNKKLRRLLGISDSASFNHKETLMRIFGTDDITPEIIAGLLDDTASEASFVCADGNTTEIAWSTSLFKQKKDFSLYLSAGFNMTEIKNMQRSLSDTNERFNLSMELSEIGILMSYDMVNFHASPETVRMLGLESSIIGINEFRSLIHPNDRIQYDSWFKMIEADNASSSGVKCIELRIRSVGGMYRWYSYRFKMVRASGNAALIGGALLDITTEREKDILIERLAFVDEVTEIPNRNKLMRIGQETYECCKHLNYTYWIIVFDIDRFHIVNDTCGYDSGNKLLKDFAHLLYKFVGTGGLAARISGDNFALILRDYGDDELPVRTAMTIQEDMTKLAVNEFASLNLTCSAGYSRMPDDGNSFLDIFEHAEFALKSGSSSQSSISCYEPSMHDSIIGNTELEKALSDAIDNDELRLFYQPKIDLATGKIMGVEALVRWIKPDGTIVRPDVFIPIAESSHLVGRISEFVLNEACRQNMLWQRMGFKNIVMSINFASSDFYQKDLKDKVMDALIKSGLEPKWLEVELTETLALRDIDFAVAQMNKLRELGVKLAMDDFGTGYSSLSYLQVLPITLLKLDRSFITDIEHDSIAFEIVSSVIRIAKSKKIEIIAEGIENENQANILRNAGCDFAQGFLYGKPVPPEKITEFLEPV
ncbi:MAG: EAL domain-containing protein [Oscillospiraceae bacterium]|nr:EAL domain-containing protein [Oscillospiraceae bacterium]